MPSASGHATLRPEWHSAEWRAARAMPQISAVPSQCAHRPGCTVAASGTLAENRQGIPAARSVRALGRNRARRRRTPGAPAACKRASRSQCSALDKPPARPHSDRDRTRAARGAARASAGRSGPPVVSWALCTIVGGPPECAERAPRSERDARVGARAAGLADVSDEDEHCGEGKAFGEPFVQRGMSHAYRGVG
eukprot:ctg_100.g94